jgi:hypothetical protein
VNAGARVLRYSTWDGLFVSLSVAHLAVLVAAPSIAVIAIGQWWNANTIAHNFIHRPFFRSPAINRLYSVFLSLLLGFPQTLWRARHLLHHAGVERRARVTRPMAIEGALVASLFIALGIMAPQFFLYVYLPGWLIGLGLCQLQGHFEHARGTTSHYGRIYNLLFFNDGFHVEHHRRPAAHWTELPRLSQPTSQQSRWPPVLRWLDAFSLAGLERLVLRSPALQRWVIRVHERAVRRVLGDAADVRRALVVGGGLFPRSALVLRRVNPSTDVTIVDIDAAHLEVAKPFLPADVSVQHVAFDRAAAATADLVVIPLAFLGDRRAIYDCPPARRVIVHDWIWNVPARAGRSTSVIVSWLLLKRLTLITSSAR